MNTFSYSLWLCETIHTTPAGMRLGFLRADQSQRDVLSLDPAPWTLDRGPCTLDPSPPAETLK